MLVVSYFTRNGNYPQLAQRLKESCERLKLPNRIVEIADLGQWKSSAAAKSAMILQLLMDLRQLLLWVDVDCEILQMPFLFWQADHDFAVYNWRADPANPIGFPYDPNQIECSSGVLYFAYTAPALELAMRWRSAVGATPDNVDDRVLDEVYRRFRPPVRPLWLPRTYNFMTGHFGQPTADVVIRHDWVDSAHREANSK